MENCFAFCITKEDNLFSNSDSHFHLFFTFKKKMSVREVAEDLIPFLDYNKEFATQISADRKSLLWVEIRKGADKTALSYMSKYDKDPKYFNVNKNDFE
jgi:hypothetical protein